MYHLDKNLFTTTDHMQYMTFPECPLCTSISISTLSVIILTNLLRKLGSREVEVKGIVQNHREEMRFELRFQQGTSFFPLYDLRTQDSLKYGQMT